MTEARIVAAEEGGRAPDGDGWFVLNAKDARWLDGELGKYTGFEGKDARFPQLGINLNVMNPGEPMTMYHRENAQEDFLVLAGEALLIVEGQERSLKQWDFVHCPPETRHAFVGAGDSPCVLLSARARASSRRTVRGASTASTRLPRATTRRHPRKRRMGASPTPVSRRRRSDATPADCFRETSCGRSAGPIHGLSRKGGYWSVTRMNA